MATLADEIRLLSAKLAEFKEIYFIRMREREQAGQQYVALQDELDDNKQVIHTSYRTLFFIKLL